MNAAGVMGHEPGDAPAARKQRVLGSSSMHGSEFSEKPSLTRPLVAILANKVFAVSVIVSIGFWLLVIPAFAGTLGANPAEKLLHQSGEIAVWTLGAVLSLSPLRVVFPRSRVANALNRHRRAVGVSACVYGLIHFGVHLLYEGDAQAIARSFSKPFIWLGLAGLTILVILAATSNNFAIRKLGGKNWKRLHRLAYAAAALLIYHQAIAGKGHWHVARWLLLALLALQTARITKQLVTRRARIMRTMSGAPVVIDAA
jgi:sulfoxide reductase heme-binding subunit YedZ